MQLRLCASSIRAEGAVVDSIEQQEYAISRLNDPGWIAYCARRYRSFDPYTGTYLGFDGLRHYCR